MTLSGLPIVITIQKIVVGNVNHMLSALAILIGYQYALVRGGLEEYIMNAPRIDFFSKNREGICSLAGYLGLYLIGAALGKSLLQAEVVQASGSGKNFYQPHWRRIRAVIGYCLLLGVLTYVSISYFGILVSRRVANISYVLFYSFSITANVCCYFLIEYFLAPVRSRRRIPEFIRGINDNQLVFFLISNLATGLINMRINTMAVGDVHALLILGGYMFGVTGCASVLSAYHVRIK